MQTDKPKPTDIDGYITDFPEVTQALLQLIRACIQAAAPEATATIGYAMPTFEYYGNKEIIILPHRHSRHIET